MIPEAMQAMSVGVVMSEATNAALGIHPPQRVPSAAAVHPTGGVSKPGEFRNSEGQYSSGNARVGVSKPAENRNEYDELASALAELQPGVDERARALGVGQAATAALKQVGRPAVVTPAVAEQICLLVAIGFSRRQAAAYLGLSPAAITRAVARDPELGLELQRATELADLQPELTLMAEARKNWRAAAWYLQFRAKNPRPLSEEEKEERHRARLADERRSAEATRAWMQGIRGAEAPSSGQPGTLKVVRKPRRGR